jgi:hypothetical protein
MTRWMTHTSHYGGQQLALLRMLGRKGYSNYGPTADTGGYAKLRSDHLRVTQTRRLCSNAKALEGVSRRCPAVEIAGDGTA